MIALVTGLEGFVGAHLAAALEKVGQQAVALRESEVDLCDSECVLDKLAEVKPERVYHLAAMSNVGQSWKDPAKTFEVNVAGTRHLLEAIKEKCPAARMLFVSSGSVYGPPRPGGSAFREDDVPMPANPYSVSKLAAEMQCLMFHQKHGLDVRIVRPLGHTGPGQLKGFVVPDFASQVAAIRLGRSEPTINVGNLEVKREFSDVRDVARAYLTIMEKGESGRIYNLASNEPRSIGDVLMTLASLAGINAEVVQDETKIRPADESTPVLDTSSLKALGFDFEIPFEKTMGDVLNEWLDKQD